jgi:hypothetical protein
MITLNYEVPYDMFDVSATRSIEVQIDCDADLHGIVESFESFIRSVGFVFPGAIEINEQAHMSDKEVDEKEGAYDKALKDYDFWVHDNTKLNGNGCESQAAADCYREEDNPEKIAQMLRDKKEIAKCQSETVEYMKEVQKLIEAISK